MVSSLSAGLGLCSLTDKLSSSRVQVQEGIYHPITHTLCIILWPNPFFIFPSMLYEVGCQTATLNVVTVRVRVSCEVWMWNWETLWERMCSINFVWIHGKYENKESFTALFILERVSLYLGWYWQRFKAGSSSSSSSSSSPSSGWKDSGACAHCTCKSDDLHFLCSSW